MDEFISSTHTVEEAHITTTAKQMLATAGMELCKLMINSDKQEKNGRSSVNHMVEPETNGGKKRTSIGL